MSNTNHNEYQIFITCLASYNQGHLYGEWVDATLSPEELQAETQRILSESPAHLAEEWFITDYELDGFEISEYESYERVSKIANFLADNDEDIKKAFNYLCENLGYEEDEAIERAPDVQFYESDSLDIITEYAEELFNELYAHDIPEHLRYYIDYEAFGRELEIGGDIYELDRCTLVTNPSEF